MDEVSSNFIKSYIANIQFILSLNMRIRKALNIENSEDAVFISRIASVFSHPVRIALFKYVKSKDTVRNDVCNKDLVEHFDYSQSSLSQHVKKLVEADLFTVIYKDKFSYYSVNKQTMSRFTSLLKEL